MTQDEIKKGLEYAARVTGNGVFAGAYKIITEQEIEIERLRDDYARVQEPFAQYQMASDKEIKAQIKQAQIDILNKAKTNLSKSDDFMDICSWHIDKIIEEIEK